MTVVPLCGKEYKCQWFLSGSEHRDLTTTWGWTVKDMAVSVVQELLP